MKTIQKQILTTRSNGLTIPQGSKIIFITDELGGIAIHYEDSGSDVSVHRHLMPVVEQMEIPCTDTHRSEYVGTAKSGGLVTHVYEMVLI